MLQFMQKSHENQVDTQYLLADYKAAFDKPIKIHIFAAIFKLDFAVKLIRFCVVTLSNTSNSVKVGKHLSEPFDTVRGFRQDDS